MAPGEVKVLTLEQVDDLFRLEMIDGDTLLRQDGTEEWLPLRVVAGLDDEAPAPPVRSAPPPPPAPLPPPVQSAPPPAALPPADAAAPFTHSPSFTPPPPSTFARSVPPSAPAPSFTPPPPSVPAPSFTPPSLAPPVIASLAPLPFTPPASPTRASRMESVLIGLAALLGLVVALQRNGTLATLFASAGQGAAYTRLEASLGGPGFGTPRAVDALVSQTRLAP
jgi:hypothetical protein